MSSSSSQSAGRTNQNVVQRLSSPPVYVGDHLVMGKDEAPGAIMISSSSSSKGREKAAVPTSRTLTEESDRLSNGAGKKLIEVNEQFDLKKRGMPRVSRLERGSDESTTGESMRTKLEKLDHKLQKGKKKSTTKGDELSLAKDCKHRGTEAPGPEAGPSNLNSRWTRSRTYRLAEKLEKAMESNRNKPKGIVIKEPIQISEESGSSMKGMQVAEEEEGKGKEKADTSFDDTSSSSMPSFANWPTQWQHDVEEHANEWVQAINMGNGLIEIPFRDSEEDISLDDISSFKMSDLTGEGPGEKNQVPGKNEDLEVTKMMEGEEGPGPSRPRKGKRGRHNRDLSDCEAGKRRLNEEIARLREQVERLQAELAMERDVNGKRIKDLHDQLLKKPDDPPT